MWKILTLVSIFAPVVLAQCDSVSSLCPAVDGAYSVYIPLENCSAFCQCAHGQAYYFPCPNGLHFNPTLNVCDWPQAAGCSGNTPSLPSTTSSGSTSGDSNNEDDCDQLSSLCPAVGSMDSVYIPLANCSAFCQCSNGQAYYVPCPSGFHFNPTLNVCDWPESAGCTESAISTSTVIDTDGDYYCEASICQLRPDEDFLSAHPTECSKYVHCNYGEALEMSCPDGLNFDENLSVCNLSGCTLYA